MNTNTPMQGARNPNARAHSSKRPVKSAQRGKSALQRLEMVAACEPIWKSIENLEAFHHSANPARRVCCV